MGAKNFGVPSGNEIKVLAENNISNLKLANGVKIGATYPCNISKGIFIYKDGKGGSAISKILFLKLNKLVDSEGKNSTNFYLKDGIVYFKGEVVKNLNLNLNELKEELEQSGLNTEEENDSNNEENDSNNEENDSNNEENDSKNEENDFNMQATTGSLDNLNNKKVLKNKVDFYKEIDNLPINENKKNLLKEIIEINDKEINASRIKQILDGTDGMIHLDIINILISAGIINIPN